MTITCIWVFPKITEWHLLQLEKAFRSELQEEFKANENNAADLARSYLDYVNRTIAAANACEIHIFKDLESTNISLQNASQVYEIMSTALQYFLVMENIRLARRARGYSIVLDVATKEKRRIYINNIKTIIDRLEIPTKKKEA